MKGLMEREFIAQLAIILGLSLGGWALFVHPKTAKLSQLETVFSAVPQNEAMVKDGTIEHLANMLAGGQRQITAVHYRNKLAENVTLLYGMLSELAARHAVTVQSMTPATRATGPQDRGIAATRVDMVLEGTYGDIAIFVDAIRELPGFIRPVTLTVKPAGTAADGLATANYSCEIVHFVIRPELAEMGAKP